MFASANPWQFKKRRLLPVTKISPSRRQCLLRKGEGETEGEGEGAGGEENEGGGGGEGKGEGEHQGDGGGEGEGRIHLADNNLRQCELLVRRITRPLPSTSCSRGFSRTTSFQSNMLPESLLTSINPLPRPRFAQQVQSSFAVRGTPLCAASVLQKGLSACELVYVCELDECKAGSKGRREANAPEVFPRLYLHRPRSNLGLP